MTKFFGVKNITSFRVDTNPEGRDKRRYQLAQVDVPNNEISATSKDYNNNNNNNKNIKNKNINFINTNADISNRNYNIFTINYNNYDYLYYFQTVSSNHISSGLYPKYFHYLIFLISPRIPWVGHWEEVWGGGNPRDVG